MSVIVPAHNHATYLPTAVQSILGQSCDDADIEVIVVDDGSTDGTEQVLGRVGDARVRALTQPNQGAAAARNTGIAHARGEVLAFLDADDVWCEHKLARALSAIREPEAPSMHFTMIQEFNDPSIMNGFGVTPTPRLLRGVAASCLTLRRQEFDRVGPFAEDLQTGEFMDWYLRARSAGLTEVLDPEALVARRIHHGNRDRLTRDSSRAYASIILAARKRATTSTSDGDSGA